MNTKHSFKNALIIGSSGKIAQAFYDKLQQQKLTEKLYTVSRQAMTPTDTGHQHFQVRDYSEDEISKICKGIPNHSLDLVICTLGTLHSGEPDIQPEKKLEDIKHHQLEHYFHINSILPGLWLSQLVNKMAKRQSTLVLFSARVGSINDNNLGGWYGYRASKAALNMLVKTAQVEYQRRNPGCDLVLYHPGTVDTPLSKPFQRNVKPEKLFTAEFTTDRLFDILHNKPNTAPPFYLDWQNQQIAW